MINATKIYVLLFVPPSNKTKIELNNFHLISAGIKTKIFFIFILVLTISFVYSFFVVPQFFTFIFVPSNRTQSLL